MNKLKRNYGITLVALVITIIILLILAGVTVGIATNGTGLFDKAKLATDEYNNSVDEENNTFMELEEKINLVSRDSEKGKLYKIGTYTSDTVGAGANIYSNMETANTIQIDISQKNANYKNFTKDNFITSDSGYWSDYDYGSTYITYGHQSSKVISYESETGLLTILKAYGYRDDSNNTYDSCFQHTTTVYLIENVEMIDLSE